MEELFFDEPLQYQEGANIKVVGVGGCGGNAVQNMVDANIEGVEFIAVNTDYQALRKTKATTQILISKSGLGAGGNPEIGKQLTLNKLDDIKGTIQGADLVFITAGMGGGTGTGGSPVIAQLAKQAGALTIGVVTMPTKSSGDRKIDIAKAGLEELIRNVDSYIVVPNDGMNDAGHKLTAMQARRMADDVLRQSIESICKIVLVEGYENIDFADVQTAMVSKGKAVMGIGESNDEEDRATAAFQKAISSPMMIDVSIAGAAAVLYQICGTEDGLMQDEIDRISQLVHESVNNKSVLIKQGVVFDNSMGDKISVTIVATGISEKIPAKIVEGYTKIQDVKIAKPIAANVMNMNKNIHRILGDKNIPTFENVNEEYYDIPTYIRRQSD